MMAELRNIAMTCPICSRPIECPVTATPSPALVPGVSTGGNVAALELGLDPGPLAAHLLECMAPRLGGDDLLGRLDNAARRLEELGHSEGLHDDIRTAITRIRLAETSAHWALGRRDLLRPGSTEPELVVEHQADDELLERLHRGGVIRDRCPTCRAYNPLPPVGHVGELCPDDWHTS